MRREAEGSSEFFLKQSGGAEDEIFFIHRDRGVGTGHRVRAGFGDSHVESVVEADGDHEGLDTVESVIAFSEDAEREIQFGGSVDDHGGLDGIALRGLGRHLTSNLIERGASFPRRKSD